MWAVLAALHPVSIHPERVSHYQRPREEKTGAYHPFILD